MTELIKIEARDGLETVNARELHEFLGVGKVFGAWIADRIEKYGFVVGKDYVTWFPNSESEMHGGQNRKEYYLSLDMAKELSMVENNAQGRLARQYFIECERRAKAVQAPAKLPEGPTLVAMALIEAEKMLRGAEAKIAELTPDALAARCIAGARGLKTLSEVGKINGIGPHRIFELLASRKIIYRRRGAWVPFQEHINAGRFIVRETTYGDLYEEGHLRTQTYVTGKGEVWLAKQFFPVTPAALSDRNLEALR